MGVVYLGLDDFATDVDGREHVNGMDYPLVLGDYSDLEVEKQT